MSNRRFSKLAKSVTADGQFTTDAISPEAGAGIPVSYDSSGLFPLESLTEGQVVYSEANNTLYMTNGSGWFKISTVNSTPIIDGLTFEDGWNLDDSTYYFDSAISPLIITVNATDPDSTPLTYSLVANSTFDSYTSNTITGNQISITLNDSDETVNVSNLTVRVSDGVNIATTVSPTIRMTTNDLGSIFWSVDLTNVTYDSVSFDVSSQASFPREIAFNNGGTKMYIIGAANDAVYQYTLGTAFDLSTASYDSVSLDVSAAGDVPLGLAFNNDGTKMYILGQANDTVFQYSLSTGFDLSTASYDSVSFSITSQDAAPFDIAFNNDGTKMYMVGTSNDAVFQYSLSTGFDLSTASYDSVSFDVTSQDATPLDIAFNYDGTKMYIIGAANDAVYQYTLGTAFDLSTASYDSVSFDVTSQDAEPYSIAFSADGTKMYIVGGSNNRIYQYSTGL